MAYSKSTVLVTGHAKPVKEDAINAVYQVLSLSVVIDTETDRIVGVSCTMVMREPESFISELFIGKNILTDMELICQSVTDRFLSIAQRPLIVALKDVQNRYLTAFPKKRA